MHLQDTVSGRLLPVFASPDGRLLFKQESIAGLRPSVVLSIPKSGTYQIAALLRLGGLIDCEIHLGDGGFSDYRDGSLDQKRREYLQFSFAMPLSVACGMVGPGQFAVGHLPCSDAFTPALGGFNRLFALRDVRDALVSLMRFIAAYDRGGPTTREWRDLPDGPDKMLRFLSYQGEWMMNASRAMRPWLDDPAVLPVRFEVLNGDHGTQAQTALATAILERTGAPLRDDPAGLLQRVMQTDTITRSGQRSDRSAFWDQRVEDWFAAHDGPALNAALGYGEP